MSSSFQPLSDSVYNKKYQLHDKYGNVIDQDREATFARVAKALAKNEEDSGFWEEKFLWAMRYGAIPAGRILSNAGAEEQKPNTSLINCLAGETPVLTRSGVKTIRSLAELDSVEVLNGNGDWSKVTFKSYGVQPVHKIHFRYADSKTTQVVRVTPNHRWVMPNGRVITTEFWLSGGRAKGYSTLQNIFVPNFDIDVEDYNNGLVHGAVYGDGNRNNHYEDRFDLTLCAHKMELSDLFSEVLNQVPKGPYILNSVYGTEGVRFNKIESDFDLKEIPHESISNSYLKGFLAGLLCTDGGVYGSEERSICVAVYGDYSLISFLEMQLPRIGIVPSVITKNIGRSGECTNFGVRNKDIYTINLHPATIDPNDLLLSKQREVFRISENGLRRSKVWVFDSIDPKYELAEVFCCEEPHTKSFCILHGLLTGNCLVSRSVEDSITGISEALKESLISLSAGSGVGYEFSLLRPKGAFVNGVGAKTSGPLPFAEIFDRACATIASAGGRRGAQMATFDLRHPDVVDFIKVKREDGRFRQFNISVLVPDDFMKQSPNEDWIFRFPIRVTDIDFEKTFEKNLWDYWPVEDEYYVYNDKGLTLFKEYGRIKKKELLDLIMKSTYDYSEPGVIFIDRVNQENNLWFCEDVRASNPCSEQMLPPSGACLLGSIDLTKFVRNPFTGAVYFDWHEYKRVVAVFTRMLDNVVEFSNLPIQQQKNEILYKRRHGMGIFGLGSALCMLKIRYGTSEAIEFIKHIMLNMAIVGYRIGVILAKEKGPAPIFNSQFEITPTQARFNQFGKENIGKTFYGRDLFTKSSYMQRLFAKSSDYDLLVELQQHGCRFTHHTSVAPTGTISLALGNNASNGIEPDFSHFYYRNLTVEGKKTRQQEAVYSKSFLEWKAFNNPDCTDEELLKNLPNYFATADSLTWKEHIDMMAAAQEFTDSSISKTINVPTNISFGEFKDVYQYAYDQGCKSVATYRYNPETLGAILSRSEDLESSRYQFTLENGTVVECKGGDKILYDGETTTAENLFNSLKENLYGRF